MFVSAETVAGVPFSLARERLAGLAGGWLADAAGAAYVEGGRVLARVDPAPGLSRLAGVRFREVVAHPGLALMVLQWQAARPSGRLFPVLDADLRLWPREPWTRVELTGVYRPPLDAAGATLDREALQLIAAETVRRFVDQIAAVLADPAAAAAHDPQAAMVAWVRIP